MMTNLFSIFDPSTSIMFQMNWISIMIPLLIIPQKFWLINSNFQMIWYLINKKIYSEFKILLMKHLPSSIFFPSMLMFILFINFMGLFPYIFTSSSHMNFSLSFSLSLWIGLMLNNWINFTEHSFAHLVPNGTPNLLMSFMVLIESISNFIRPGTLAIRLSANMIAGHLLLTLLGSSCYSFNLLIIMIIIIIQTMLLMLEMSVAIIQSYVFSILSILYSTEIN